MSMKTRPELLKLLNQALMDADSEQDEATTAAYAAKLSGDALDRLQSQIQTLIEADAIALDEIGAESNRWFGTEEEARIWLTLILKSAVSSGASGEALIVKDSNGAVLLEGDSVTVIKDLKVKGGSSDLKRGTLVKKIHLTSDPDLVECRVDGSTLVLRTEFLKKTT